MLSATVIETTHENLTRRCGDGICPKKIMMLEPWVAVDNVANHLGVAKDTVYRWIDTKGLPAHRVGRLWKFRLSEVDRWIEAGGASQEEQPKRAQE